MMQRPYPPSQLLDDTAELIQPAPEIAAWLSATFLDAISPLYNEDHAHLESAYIGCLWTNVANRRQMRDIAATAEVPLCNAGVWQKARHNYQLTQWFGEMPDFLLTFYAAYANECSNDQWCALVEHELYHCAQKVMPNGSTKWAMRGHDVEEFVGIVERYGVGAAAGATAALVAAAQSPPRISAAEIIGACGNCKH